MTTAQQRDLRNEQALDLHLAGASYARIASVLGISPATAKRAVDAALKVRTKDAGDASAAVRTELARIDSMLVGLWPKAVKGDVDSVEKAIKLGERRARLVEPRANDHAFRDAFNRSAATSKQLIGGLDDALIESGRTIADRIDDAKATAEGSELTKALYLLPHMLNVLREMLATPASRAAAGKTGNEGSGGGSTLGRLRSVHGTGQRGA